MTSRIIKTVCPRDCYDTCFLQVRVKDNQILSIRGDRTNPVTGGLICPRGAKDGERVSLNRVLYPYLKNEGGEKDFERINWHKALSIIAESLSVTLNDFGPESVLHLEYAGNTGLLTWHYPQRIWKALGATGTDNAICSRSGHEALSLHYGSSYGIQPEDLLQQKLIVFWGFNAAASSIHQWRLSQRAKRIGAKLAVIDPRFSETAQKADIWLNPQPGSDVALVYGLIRYLIEEDYVDYEFINKWTSGFEALKDEAMTWTPEKVEEATGINGGEVEKLGRAYGELAPNVTMMGIGFQKSAQGAEMVRAVGLLPALLGLHRGFYYSSSKSNHIDFSHIEGENQSTKRPQIVSQVGLSRLVKRGDFKFIFIYNMNPAMTLPNQRAFREGLTREDVFVVVHETHWTETTDFADVVLPAPTFLEKDDLVVSWSHCYLRVSNKVIPPVGESKTEVELMQELAKGIGLSEPWLYQDPWENITVMLEGTLENGSIENLMSGETVKLKSKPLNDYQTPSGKIEFYSTKALELGLNPLPVHNLPKRAKDEFVLLNSALRKYTHTQFQEVYGAIPAITRNNPKDAELLGVEEGDKITLYNAKGELKVKVEIAESLPRGVLWSPKLLTGLNKEPQNILTSGATQEIGNDPIFNSTVVRISK